MKKKKVVTKIFHNFLSFPLQVQRALFVIFYICTRSEERTVKNLTTMIQLFEQGGLTFVTDEEKIWVETVKNEQFLELIYGQIRPSPILEQNVKTLLTWVKTREKKLPRPQKE